MNLLVTEFLRFWGRRLVWGAMFVVAGLIVFGIVIAFTQTSSQVGDNSQAIADAERGTASCVRSVMRDVENGNFDSEVPGISEMSPAEQEAILREDFCYQDPSWYGDGDKRFFATEILASGRYDDWSRQRPDTGEELSFDVGGGVRVREAVAGLEGFVPSLGLFFLVMAIVIGASFVGAEYKFGTVENLLLWEPRRTRVLWTKFAAGFVGSFMVTFVMLGFFTLMLLLLAQVNGTNQGVDGRFWLDLLSTLGRAGVVGGLFFVLAMSVAVVARNTTASVGLLLGWFVISNIVISLAARWLRQWELFTNAAAFISEGNTPRMEKIQGDWQAVYGHGYLVALLVVVAWALAAAVVATVIFNRRDVD